MGGGFGWSITSPAIFFLLHFTIQYNGEYFLLSCPGKQLGEETLSTQFGRRCAGLRVSTSILIQFAHFELGVH